MEQCDEEVQGMKGYNETAVWGEALKQLEQII